MTDAVIAAREAFWCALIARFQPRARSYCRRIRCSEGEVDEILWDLWQEAAECEHLLIISRDQWPLLLDLLRRLCARQVRSWRRECRMEDGNVELSCCEQAASLEAPDVHGWISGLMEQLPPKQRQAIDFRLRWGWPYWAVALP